MSNNTTTYVDMQNLVVVYADEIDTSTVHTGTLNVANTLTLPSGSVVNTFLANSQMTLNGTVVSLGSSANLPVYTTSQNTGVYPVLLGSSNTGDISVYTDVSNSVTLNAATQTLNTKSLSVTGTITLPSSSLPLSAISGGSTGQVIVVNSLGNPIYTNQINLETIPYGLNNQILQTTSTLNRWVTISGDATLSSGVLTLGVGSVTNTKLANSTVQIGGTTLTLGAANTSTLVGPLSITGSLTTGSLSTPSLTSTGSVTVPALSLGIAALDTTGSTNGYALTSSGSALAPTWKAIPAQTVTYLRTIVSTNVYNILFSLFNAGTGYYSTYVDPLLSFDNSIGRLSSPFGCFSKGTSNLGQSVITAGAYSWYSLFPTDTSLILGASGTNDGTLFLCSTNSNGSSYTGAVIQANLGSLYLDVSATNNVGPNPSVNIGTLTSYSGINFGTNTTTHFTYKDLPFNNVSRYTHKAFYCAVTSTTYVLMTSTVAPLTTPNVTITVRNIASYLEVRFLSPVNHATTAGQIWYTVGVSGGSTDISGGLTGGLFLAPIGGSAYNGVGFSYQFPATDVMTVAGTVTLQMYTRINGGTGMYIGYASPALLQFTVTEIW